MRRKILAMLMVFSMILGSIIPVSASVYVPPLEMAFVNVDNFENGKDMEAQWKVTNTSQEEVTGYFIAGLYEEGTNELVSYTYVKDTMLGEETKQYGVGISMPDEGKYVLKVFAWDDMDNPKTLSNIIQYSGEDTGERDIHKEVKDAINETAEVILEKVPAPQVSSVGGEWAVLGLARAGYDVPADYFENYYSTAKQHVVQESGTNNEFYSRVTEVQRISLAFSAIGKNPEDVGGIDLHDYIWNKANHFPNLSETQKELGGYQGTNELVFGLLALDAREYEEPEHVMITRAQIIDKLVNDYQLPDGGFGLSAGSSSMNSDMTAMAIQALAPYYDQCDDVKEAIDGSIHALEEAQRSDGLFAGIFPGSDSVETLAQVIVALTAMGIDPHTDERFIKGDVTPITALLDVYYLPDGGFRQTSTSSQYNQMSTEQAMYALVAYDRYLEGKNSLYDMTDVELIPDEEENLVTLSIEKRLIGKGDTISSVEVELLEGDTVWDVIKREVEKRNIEIDYEFGEWGVYIKSIDGDGQFNYGPESGWMYHVDGEEPWVSMDQYILEAEQVVKVMFAGHWEDIYKPMVEVLEKYIDQAKAYEEEDYTGESYGKLVEAIEKAEAITNNLEYQGTDLGNEKELIMNDHIAALLTAIDGLEQKEVIMLPEEGKVEIENPMEPAEEDVEIVNPMEPVEEVEIESPMEPVEEVEIENPMEPVEEEIKVGLPIVSEDEIMLPIYPSEETEIMLPIVPREDEVEVILPELPDGELDKELLLEILLAMGYRVA